MSRFLYVLYLGDVLGLLDRTFIVASRSKMIEKVVFEVISDRNIHLKEDFALTKLENKMWANDEDW